MKNLFQSIEIIAKSNPNKIAIKTCEENITYENLYYRITRLKFELEKSNCSRLAIFASNTPDWIILDLAAILANISVIPIPLFFTDEQIRLLLNDSKVDLLFYSKKTFPEDPEWIKNFSQNIKNNFTQEVEGVFYSIGSLVPRKGEFGPSKITYTSGSTGTPKGVCLSSETMESVTKSLAYSLKNTNLNTHLCLIPFATLLENIAGVYLGLSMGLTLVVGNIQEFGLISNHEFMANRFFAVVKKYQINSVILLPQMLKSIIEHALLNGNQDLQSLKFVAVGGGKVSPSLLKQAQTLGIPVYEGYGLSECASVVSLNLPNHYRIGSVGKVLPHVEVQISNEGEIIVSGNAMQGYLNSDFQSDSLIYTGDAGFLDEDGFLFVTGRIKQIIISSFGRNISPEWVESFALSEAEIAQICVFGEAQPFLSAVIYAPGRSESEINNAIDRINSQLPDYAHIKHWISAKIPFSFENNQLTNTGKLRRDVIFKQYQENIYGPKEVL